MNFRYCPHCGSKLSVDAQFCTQCGAKLDPIDSTEDSTNQSNFNLDSWFPSTSNNTNKTKVNHAKPYDKESINHNLESYASNDIPHFRSQDTKGEQTDSLLHHSTEEFYNESGKPGFTSSFNVYIQGLLKINKCMGRADYWYSYFDMSLISCLNVVILILLAYILQNSVVLFATLSMILYIISFLFGLSFICPTIQRIHDTGRSGWMILLGLIPIVNLWILCLLCSPTDWNEKRWPRPLQH